jgi:hypothetical protein
MAINGGAINVMTGHTPSMLLKKKEIVHIVISLLVIGC